MIQLNPTVGVAPGTITMTLGEHPPECPPDPIIKYTVPPEVVSNLGGVIYDPYIDIVRLQGLRGFGDAAPRWGLVLFAGLATFAAVLGYRRWRG